MPKAVDIDALWDYGNPAASEARFRDALASLPEDAAEADRLELETQLARALGLQGKFDDAHRVLDGLEEALAGNALPRPRVRYLLERGRTLNSSGAPEEAQPLFEEAWNLARRHPLDGLAVDAAHMVAIAAGGQDSVAWNERALDLARSSEDPTARRWQGSLLNNLGWDHHSAGRHAEALALFEEALAFRRDAGTEGPIRTARWCVARAKRSLGRVEEALAEQRQLLEEGTDDGFVHEELGELLLALDRSAEAAPHFQRAYELLRQDAWFVAEHPERLERLHQLAG
jgi:tetratricopeptide (TPR) repeat protein